MRKTLGFYAISLPPVLVYWITRPIDSIQKLYCVGMNLQVQSYWAIYNHTTESLCTQHATCDLFGATTANISVGSSLPQPVTCCRPGKWIPDQVVDNGWWDGHQRNRGTRFGLGERGNTTSSNDGWQILSSLLDIFLPYFPPQIYTTKIGGLHPRRFTGSLRAYVDLTSCINSGGYDWDIHLPVYSPGFCPTIQIFQAFPFYCAVVGENIHVLRKTMKK